MQNAKDVCYTLINNSYYSKMSEAQLKSCLEYGSVEAKRNALKEIIISIANGETNDSFLILIIRFILPVQDRSLRKLLLLFWELYPKVTNDGELIKEMILVCDSFRKDLQHPNEYMRGVTLRFLCKLKEPEILEPLIGAIRANLKHNRSYTRRNAVLAVYTIYKNYDYLIPDAPELIEEFLNDEEDTSCKRNAFIVLFNTDLDKAVKYLISSLDQVSLFDHSLQIVVIELIQKICQKNSHEKSAFIRCIYTLLDSKSNAVRYEAARALTMLTNAPTALKATISCYIAIILKASDNITKLIVLDRLVDMKYRLSQKKILQECVQDILGLITRNNDVSIKTKIISLILHLTHENNADQIVTVLKKEISKEDTSIDDINYKIFLIQKLHSWYFKFPQTAIEIILFLNNLVTNETDERVLKHILTHIKEAAHDYKQIIPIVVGKLKDSLSTVTRVDIFCTALWILTEFSQKDSDMEFIVQEVHHIVIEMSYAMCNALSENQPIISQYLEKNSREIVSSKTRSIVKVLVEDILNGTGFMCAGIGSSVGKLMIRYQELYGDKIEEQRSLLTKTLSIIILMLHFNRLNNNWDSCNRLVTNLILILKPKEQIVKRILIESKKSLMKMLTCYHILDSEDLEGRVQVMQPDESVCLLQGSDCFMNKQYVEFDNFDETRSTSYENDFKLDKIVQLTGFSDPIYAEAKLIHTSEQNIALNIILINRTDETLQNCSVELATFGELIITDKPQSKTLGPEGRTEILVNVKVALTGNSIIFGNIVYDTTCTIEHGQIVLNDITIDVIDYIKPCDCPQDNFRKIWQEFEWENKVYLAPKRTNDLTDFLNEVTKYLHMKCLTPREAMAGESSFLTANLHGKSIFGESVIANLSLEKDTETKWITGHIRLRAKSQGIVIGLGEIIRCLPC